MGAKGQKKRTWLKVSFALLAVVLCSCSKNISYSGLGQGWSKNTVNTVKFRKNALTTFKNHQFIAYYDHEGVLVLGKRKVNTLHWKILKTQYKGNSKDAHNSISIAVDGDGFLHVSWDHHNTELRYAVSKTPFGLELGPEQAMTGKQEHKVTYPEFYRLPNGNLLFFYRSGQSGRGNLVINSYSTQKKQWAALQNNLIDGEGKRSAYWQACVDAQGTIHVSWVWRETWDVETNHDLCYAKSTDGGQTWQKSNGEPYTLPITLATAEYAWKIPQNNNLINQTAMTADKKGNPFIASYWNNNEIPQYQIVYWENGNWNKISTGFRSAPFVLGGGGTKKIPMSRPDILIDYLGQDPIVNLLFRDAERGNKISLASLYLNKKQDWQVKDLTESSKGEWEPNYDVALWQSRKELHLFVQNVSQIDGEGIADTKPTEIEVLQIKNITKLYNK